MPTDSNLILINSPAFAHNGTQAGSGSDPTAGSGAVVNVDERIDNLFVCAFYAQPTGGTAAADTETLGINVQVSDDNGSHWNTVSTFRNVLGSELPTSATAIDKPTVQLAVPLVIPKLKTTACQVRLQTVASDGDSWGLYADIRGKADVREAWLINAGIKS